MKYIFSIVLLTICIISLAQKQSGQNKKRFRIFKKHELNEYFQVADTPVTITDINPEGLEEDICIWPPPGFKEIYCKSELVAKTSSGDRSIEIYATLDTTIIMSIPDNPIDLSMISNNMISTKNEFTPFAKRIKLEVDWEIEKLTFYTNSRTYKHGHLNSDGYLMGVSISEDGKILCLGYSSRFHGVCQGIAQQPEWYSDETETYAIIIPGTVERIMEISCYFGPDCSEIP